MWSSKLRNFENLAAFPTDLQNDTVSIGDDQRSITAEPTNQSYGTSFKEIMGYGIGITSAMTEILISHPFLVIRHQCQVRSWAKQSHILPFTLIPVVQNYVANQGILTLWKGLSGVLTIKVFTILTENLIAEILPLPKGVSTYSSPKKISLYLLMKAMSLLICTPFYAASIVEFVQSDIASEPSSLISCTLEGFRRLAPFSSGPRLGSLTGNLKAGLKSIPIRTSRLLPIWKLVLPVVVLGLGQHVIRSFVNQIAASFLQQDEQEPEQIEAEAESRLRLGMQSPLLYRVDSGNSLALIVSQRQEAALQSTYLRFCTDLTASLWSSLAADVLLYPLETIVVRLCVQGTRTLVDNLDTGSSVLPIVSAFDGPLDAFRFALSSPSSLYRGFGALIAQYLLNAAFLWGIRCAYEHLLCYYTSLSQPPPPPPYPPLQQHSASSNFPAVRQPIGSQYAASNGATASDRENQPPQGPASSNQRELSSSVWQPMADQARWESSSSRTLEETVAVHDPSNIPTSMATVTPGPLTFRGYSPSFYDSFPS